jgi:predicted dehydrogenase
MEHDHTSRRDFLRIVGGACVAAPTLGSVGPAEAGQGRQPTASVAGLTAAKVDLVRWGLVGVGERGAMHLDALLRLDGCEVTGICDPWAPALSKALDTVVKAGRRPAAGFGGGPTDYLRLFDRDDVDAVILSTPWEQHVGQAVAAMRAGKHVFIEVPAATTVEECWQLVEAAEATRRHCMMLENVCYGRDELMVLNMCRRGLLGELTHAEASYIHDLRSQEKQVEWGTGSWRVAHYERRNGNVYPTHGLGPVAQYLNINRGDAFGRLVSMSSPSRGYQLYAAREFPPDHPRNRATYVCGDMNTSLVQTALGRTIMIQHDVATPRPYSRHNYVQGTKGAFSGFPSRIAVEGRGDFHRWDTDLAKWYAEFDHPLWKTVGEIAAKVGGHGGMDFVMLWRLVKCLREGLALDQDVYDAASWSVVSPLSEQSVARGGAPVEFPDFTRGAWKTVAPLGVVA